MDEELTAAVLAAAFFSEVPSGGRKRRTNASTENLLRLLKEEQHVVDGAIKKNYRKTSSWKKEADADYDDEFRAKLKNALSKYKKNKKPEGKDPEPSTRPPKQDTALHHDFNNGGKRSETEKNLSKGENYDGNAITDIAELSSFFLGAMKNKTSNGHTKSYSEYEKLGAIPKRKVKIESDRAKSLQYHGSFQSEKTNGDTGLSKSKGHKRTLADDEILKLSEGACLRPFFYIVPENPSPEFFLPRGSYYVVPSAPPGSSTDDNIVFHPEKSTQDNIKRGGKNRMRPKIEQNLSELNNLSKDILQRVDSHLNIGPGDVKITESSNNLETNSADKIYNKACVNPGFSENASMLPEIDEAVCVQEIELLNRMTDISTRLKSEFPDFSPANLQSFAEKYINDEAGLENFIASGRLQRRIEAQFQRLCLALPESSDEELLKKCNEFEGDEGLEGVYIEEVRRENKILQCVLDLQNIFPDADINFLRENVERLNCNSNEISALVEELLESQAYPKVLDDQPSNEKRRLWHRYVTYFKMEEFTREVRNHTEFTGPSGNNKHGKHLVYKYLEAKYPDLTASELQRVFHQNNNNLIDTCGELNERKDITFGSWEGAIQNEDYTEDFLKDICFIEHRTEVLKYYEEQNERKEIEREDALENDCFLSCPLCCGDELVASEVVTCPEGHIFCTNCVIQYVTVKMSEGVYKFVCPLEKCSTFFTLSALESLLSETVVLNIIKKQQAEEISIADVEGLESCPHCEFAYIPSPEDKIFKCQNPSCLAETCRACGDKSHIPLRCEEIERPVDLEARKKIEETMTESLVRVCPKCRKKIVKIDGCNKIACSCGVLFCYICRQTIAGYDHFKNNVRCPLYSNNEQLHNVDVVQAGVRARDEILRENPGIRFVHDPTAE